MPSYPRDEVPVAFEVPGAVEVRQVETAGGMTIELCRMEAGQDPCEFFRGLPDDMCQCPHHGYVLSGSMAFTTADGEIVVRAGDAYYIPPGHLPLTRDEAVEVVEFSPTDELARTAAVVGRNLAAAGVL